MGARQTRERARTGDRKAWDLLLPYLHADGLEFSLVVLGVRSGPAERSAAHVRGRPLELVFVQPLQRDLLQVLGASGVHQGVDRQKPRV